MWALQFFTLTAGLLLLPQVAWADHIYTKPELCVQACYESLTLIVFSDASATDTYVGAQCHSTLSVTSIYACYDAYCSEYDVDESFGYLNEYCTEYGLSPLSMSHEEAEEYISFNYGNIDNITVIDPSVTVATQNDTVIPTEESINLGYRTLVVWQHEEYIHHAFGWSMYIMAAGIVTIGVANRIFAYIIHRTLARTGPIVDVERTRGGKAGARNRGLFTKINNLWNKHIMLPATFGYRHIQPWGWCTIPTRLQSILVFVFVALNVIFCAIDYPVFTGNTYWSDIVLQLYRYIADRTGIISYANLPLLWLFAGRNDVLLWMTGWSFSTFNVFHRWIARVATVEAIVHSICYTGYVVYADNGGWADYKLDYTEQYWTTGVVATVLMSFIVIFSVYPIRRYYYEFFLVAHVTMSLGTIVMLFYHTKIFDGEYDGYLWPCVGFWVFDRFIRLVRIGMLNWRVSNRNDKLQRNKATVVYDAEGDIIRMSIRPSTNFCVGAGVHYYIHTPTLSFTLWENHPFTLSAWRDIPAGGSVESGMNTHDTEIQQVRAHTVSESVAYTTDSKEGSISSHSDSSDVGGKSSRQELIFLIRPYKGMTGGLKKRLLKARGHQMEMTVLLEGPYGTKANLNSYERVLMISGGSGVTGIISYLYEQCVRRNQHTLFVWAAKEEQFVTDVIEKDLAPFINREDVDLDFYLTRGCGSSDNKKGASVDATIARMSSSSPNKSRVTYGAKPNVAEILDYEIGQLTSQESRLAVVVCGPGRLADDVRREVVRSIGTKIDASRIELHEESFGW